MDRDNTIKVYKKRQFLLTSDIKWYNMVLRFNEKEVLVLEYKEYERHNLGVSMYAGLCLVGLTEDACLKTDVLVFGGVSAYEAYVVDQFATIPPHYKLIYTFNQLLKIYDDFELVKEFHADRIHIYRAGLYGCIIQLIS